MNSLEHEPNLDASEEHHREHVEMMHEVMNPPEEEEFSQTAERLLEERVEKAEAEKERILSEFEQWFDEEMDLSELTDKSSTEWNAVFRAHMEVRLEMITGWIEKELSKDELLTYTGVDLEGWAEHPPLRELRDRELENFLESVDSGARGQLGDLEKLLEDLKACLLAEKRFVYSPLLMGEEIPPVGGGTKIRAIINKGFESYILRDRNNEEHTVHLGNLSTRRLPEYEEYLESAMRKQLAKWNRNKPENQSWSKKFRKKVFGPNERPF